MEPYRIVGVNPCQLEGNCGGGGGGGNYTPPSYQWRFFHADHLGTPRIVTDTSGNIVSEHHYLPFGEEVPPSSHNGVVNASNNSHRFTGHERDSETGLDYMVARYFEAPLGRFMSPDPLGGQLVDPQTLNKYTYVRNNPVSLTDPTGLYTCKDSKDCSSDHDKAFEDSRKRNLKSKDGDVARAAAAYGDPGAANGVTVNFADLSSSSEGGSTSSSLGADADGNLQANSDVTIDSSASGSDLDAVVGHEGSHVADAQDVVKSMTVLDPVGGALKVGMDITQFTSEQRAYGVTDAILKSAGQTNEFRCGVGSCSLGAGVLGAKVPGIVDQILRYAPNGYTSSVNRKPLSSSNQGGSVVPH